MEYLAPFFCSGTLKSSTPFTGQARRLFKEIDIERSGFISPDEILGQTDTPAVSLGDDWGSDWGMVQPDDWGMNRKMYWGFYL
jgi:hypothetical protein